MENWFDRRKNRISLFFRISRFFFMGLQIFFHGSPDFPLSGVGRSDSNTLANACMIKSNKKPSERKTFQRIMNLAAAC